jgi:hypothetical protein
LAGSAIRQAATCSRAFIRSRKRTAIELLETVSKKIGNTHATKTSERFIERTLVRSDRAVSEPTGAIIAPRQWARAVIESCALGAVRNAFAICTHIKS